MTFFRNLPVTDGLERVALQVVQSKSIYLSASTRRPNQSNSPIPPKKQGPSLSSIQISTSWRARERGYIKSALSRLEVIGYFTQSKAHFPCTPCITPPLTLLLTTANPAANSFDAKSPLTADHFFFFWEKSHRPLMSSQHEATSRADFSFKELSCFIFDLIFKSCVSRERERSTFQKYNKHFVVSVVSRSENGAFILFNIFM